MSLQSGGTVRSIQSDGRKRIANRSEAAEAARNRRAAFSGFFKRAMFADDPGFVPLFSLLPRKSAHIWRRMAAGDRQVRCGRGEARAQSKS